MKILSLVWNWVLTLLGKRAKHNLSCPRDCTFSMGPMEVHNMPSRFPGEGDPAAIIHRQPYIGPPYPGAPEFVSESTMPLGLTGTGGRIRDISSEDKEK